MKKLVTFFIAFFSFYFSSRADHITGGEMFYTYNGIVNGTHQYRFTLKLYMRCNSGRVFNNPTIISVFDKTGNIRVMDIDVPLNRQEKIRIVDPDPCISNPPDVCYDVGYYEFNVSLPGSAQGYIVAGQVNYRISGIANLSPGYSQIGATYTAEIPGTFSSANNVVNNSARFVGSDLVVVCANNAFNYSFAASDADNDGLSYYFCEAYRSSSGPSGGGNNASAPMLPPYEPVPYGNGYNGNNPLGSSVNIDSKTGLITGIAPGPGVYVVTVCVEETRNGKVIAVQRKDLQIAITSCNLTAAILQPEYQLCRSSKTLTLTNLSLSNLINAYLWQIKDASGTEIYSSTTPTVTYTFADTGIYSIKLVINPGQRCTDSTTSVARVFPGFEPSFTFEGICFTKSTSFKDASTSVYGVVNSWSWNFGEPSANNGFASQRNPSFTYTTLGAHNAKLVATDTKGCRDSVVIPVTVFEKPPVTLAFRDTLICQPDQLQLQASGRGNYSWSPNQQIVNANTATPTVSPNVTTTYYVDLDDDGCLNRDSVLVRVTNKVSVQAMKDTTICAGDNIQLRAQTDGLYYSWFPAEQVDDASLLTPAATTPNTTVYEITSFISSCLAKDQVLVTTIPYPLADAGKDTVICFNSLATLKGTTNAAKYSWSPAATLSSSTILNPVAKPVQSTFYALTVTDNKGCPKPVTDSVLVTVLPDINPEAGNDTSVVIGESIQLNATGGIRYFWYPSTGLSSVDIPDPVALYDEPFEAINYIVRIYNEAGCVDSASLNIKVFGTLPAVFVPTGFTPNGDGKNDILRPIAVGMKKIERFIIFNRYGQQVFSTTTNGKGWDGRIRGELQETSVYVWMVEAVDYNGKKYNARGTTTLIR